MRRKAFTLLELVVATSIFAIVIAATSVTSSSRWTGPDGGVSSRGRSRSRPCCVRFVSASIQ